MSNIVKFEFKGHQVRVVRVGDHEEWVAKDVCEVLNVQNVSDVVRKSLDDDERGIATIYTPSGDQEMLTITESGLYTLILRSRKPQARAFRRWVTHEVLPQIRRTGRYATLTAKEQFTEAQITQIATIVGRMFQKLLPAVVEQVSKAAPQINPVALPETVGPVQARIILDRVKAVTKIECRRNPTWLRGARIINERKLRAACKVGRTPWRNMPASVVRLAHEHLDRMTEEAFRESCG